MVKRLGCGIPEIDSYLEVAEMTRHVREAMESMVISEKFLYGKIDDVEISKYGTLDIRSTIVPNTPVKFIRTTVSLSKEIPT